jgi:hypothetical protein
MLGKTRGEAMAPGPFDPSGLAVSIAAHLTVLAVGLGYAGVRPFEATAVEAVAVDLVPAEEVHQALQKTSPGPAPPADIADMPRPDAAAAASESPTFPQQLSASPAMPFTTAAAVKTAIKRVAGERSGMAMQPVSWRPPEPDLSVRYQVNLGLPALTGDEFDAPAYAAASLSSDDIARFREGLKVCSVLPESVAPTDRVAIRLRASFLPDGRLASAPLLIEASASAKGPLLMRAAVRALENCQPFAALPADKYGEWKVLDLSFTPQDFRRG